jgi:hypothetical protein
VSGIESKKNTRDEYSLHHHHNDCQFYLVQDSNTKVWHCVHIIHEINGHYLLKRNKAIEKGAATMEKTIEAVERSGNMSEELRQQMIAHEIEQRWKANLVKKYCTPKLMRSYIAELKKEDCHRIEKNIDQTTREYNMSLERMLEK